MTRWSIRITATLLMISAAVGIFGLNKHAQALSASSFQAGYIISDSIFTNYNAMSANDVQTFLSAQVPVCDTNGTKPISGGSQTRAQWAAQNGKPQPPYVCLKSYVENPNNGQNNLQDPSTSIPGGMSAAQIIVAAAQQYHINPQVLIVMLQKEQGLVTDDWPWPIQYQEAMGYNCPDSGGCSGFAGFYAQVTSAASQMRYYLDHPNAFNYWIGNYKVPYSPSCSGPTINIQDAATAALYIYTPYQPDSNVLAATNPTGSSSGPGGSVTGDSCAAYGNRNFWWYFNTWFGSSIGDLVKAAGDSTVYLLSSNTAYPIYDDNVFNDFYPLGPVRQTSASEINNYTLGATVARLVKDSGGTVYLINSGIKLPFSDCNLVADYGLNCGNALLLTDNQLARFVTGPPVTHLLKGAANPTVYYIEGGQKRPIPAWSDVQAFKIPYLNWLSDSYVNQIPQSNAIAYGPGSLVKTPNSTSVYVVKDSDNILPLSNFIYSQDLGLGTSPRTIISYYSVLGTDLRTKVKCDGNSYVGTNGQDYLIPSPTIMSAYGFSQPDFVDGASTCFGLPISSQPLDHFIQSATGAIFYVNNGQKQYITTYSVYQAHGGNASNTISVSNYFLNLLADGQPLSQ